MRILILGGTTEASALVERLAGKPHFNVVLSLAGRTAEPKRADVKTRIGGFGGEAGLRQWLLDNRTDAVIDATHPFAARISLNASEACKQASVPLLGLRRPAWHRQPGDLWTEVATMTEAVDALGVEACKAFLTVGRLELAAFSRAPQHHYLVRTIDPIGDALATPHITALRARGPFTESGERALMIEHGIQLLVTKNSGGSATYAKIAAARGLKIPVILVRQPGKPDVTTARNADEAMDWLVALHARTP